MKAVVREHFKIEVSKAQGVAKAGDFEAAWTALQRAHILAQAYPLPHASAHWEMLKLAWRQRDAKEMSGQFIPTVLAVPVTFLFGWKRSVNVSSG